MSFQAMAWAVSQKLPMKEKFVLLMLANQMRMQPAVLARHLIKEFIREAKGQSATTEQRTAV